jgi:hypothetical protein
VGCSMAPSQRFRFDDSIDCSATHLCVAVISMTT